MNMLGGAGGCRPPPPEYKLNVAQNMGLCQNQFPAQGYMPPARQSLPQGAQSRRPIQQQPIPPSGNFWFFLFSIIFCKRVLTFYMFFL